MWRVFGVMLGGWEISGISSFFAGEPVDFNCGVPGFSSGIGASARCDTVGAVKIHKTIANEPGYGPTLQWHDPNTVTRPTAAQMLANGETCMFGCMGPNILTGPGRREGWGGETQRGVGLHIKPTYLAYI